MDTQEILDALHNCMALIDSPVGRMKFKGEFADEVRDIGRAVLLKHGIDLTPIQ